ncbi:MAG: nucleoside recognition domain-containing protein [Rectinemataceae bacterium]
MTSDKASLPARVAAAAVQSLRASIRTIWFLLGIVIPVTLVVALLEWSGLLRALAGLVSPLMRLVGLPGEAALVIISSLFLSIYSAIAVAASLALDLREATILAFMCLTAHNLIVESAVMRKTGSSAIKMFVLRLFLAIASAFVLNLVLPASLSARSFSATASATRLAFPDMLAAWGLSTGSLALKIGIIVLVIMMIQGFLEEFGALKWLSRLFAPAMRIFGLPASLSFLWIVINLVGYPYGAGIIVKEIDEGRMKPQDGDLLNHHAGACHSLLEYTTLYVVLGIPILWITIPRILLAIIVVWAERGRRRYFRRSFRAGIA